MSVHFDFVLSDIDAENLFDIIHEAKCRFIEQSMGENKKEYADALKEHAKYIDQLKNKLKNKRCAHRKSRKR